MPSDFLWLPTVVAENPPEVGTVITGRAIFVHFCCVALCVNYRLTSYSLSKAVSRKYRPTADRHREPVTQGTPDERRPLGALVARLRPSLRPWFEFLQSRGVRPYGDRESLRAVLGAFAEYRLSGPAGARWDGATWNQRIGVLSRFYQWAVAEGHCEQVPFTYVMGTRYTEAGPVPVKRNRATVRRAKPHITLKDLEPDYAHMFQHALAGPAPDGEPDPHYRGRQLGRNAAIGALVLASGPRSQEFTYLLTYEIPRSRNGVPGYPLPGAATKGKKPREPSRRAALVVEEPDLEGCRIGGRRVAWRRLLPAERLRLVLLLRLKTYFSRQARRMTTGEVVAVFGPYAERLDHEPTASTTLDFRDVLPRRRDTPVGSGDRSPGHHLPARPARYEVLAAEFVQRQKGVPQCPIFCPWPFTSL